MVIFGSNARNNVLESLIIASRVLFEDHLSAPDMCKGRTSNM